MSKGTFTSILFLFSLHLLLSSAVAEEKKLSFAEWKQKISSSLHERGISKEVLREAIGPVTLNPRVIELDRRQPEFSESLGSYLKKRVTLRRVNKARKQLAKHRDILSLVESEYGIPREILVAFWSLETNHGSYTGKHSIIRSLITLAYDGRREKLFTDQLYYALKILQSQSHIKLQNFKGSWAGAMGHPQFMPSTFIHYAVDGNEDAKIDLWNDLEDVFHSMGNFLSSLSWNEDQRWGQEVVLSKKMNWAKVGLEWSLPVAEWIKQGVETVDGTIPSSRFQYKASIILPLGQDGPAFMVYDNFRVIMRWNNSLFYALSVGILADLIAERYYISSVALDDWQREAPSRQEIKGLQQALKRAGYNPGGVDGVIGKATRNAIVRYQLAYKLVPDGYPNMELFKSLNLTEAE